MFEKVELDDQIDNTDTPVNHLEQLVGEDKKFKTPEDLAKAKAESDSFIERLQREQAELREELNRRQSAQDILDQLEERNKIKEVNTTTPTVVEDTPKGEQVDIEKLLEEKLSKRDQENTKQQNLQQAQSKMLEKYGDKATVELNRKAERMGITVQDLQAIAETTPSVFQELMQLHPKKEHQVQMPNPSVDTARLPTSSTGETYADFEKMRKENPREYFTPKVQNRMHELANKYGDNFFNS